MSFDGAFQDLRYDRAGQNSIVPSQAIVIPGLPLPMQSSAKPLFIRTLDLCQRVFQSEPWYLDNMLFAMATMVGMACFLFTGIGQSSGTLSGLDFAIYLIPLSFGFLLCLILIPLCRILDGLEPKQLTERHPLSFVRLAIDPGKPYRILRTVYFASCPITAIMSIAIFFLIRMTPKTVIYTLFGWCSLTLAFIFAASLMVPISICRQLYSRKAVEVSCA